MLNVLHTSKLVIIDFVTYNENIEGHKICSRDNTTLNFEKIEKKLHHKSIRVLLMRLYTKPQWQQLHHVDSGTDNIKWKISTSIIADIAVCTFNVGLTSIMEIMQVFGMSKGPN